MLKIGRILLGSLQTNCYYIYEEGKKEIIVVDPAEAGEQVYQAFSEKGYKITAILLTHAHYDHIAGCNKLRELSQAMVGAWEEEKEVCESESLNLSRSFNDPYVVTVDRYFKDGEKVSAAGMEFTVIGTPGHTQGSCCYYFEKEKILISGDTLFQESVGRTDLPTGDGKKLYRSLMDRVMSLPEEVRVFPGHGGSTTIENEKKYNPVFLYGM